MEIIFKGIEYLFHLLVMLLLMGYGDIVLRSRLASGPFWLLVAAPVAPAVLYGMLVSIYKQRVERESGQHRQA